MAPRRVGLHSIGIGGVNAHVLLEEAPLATAPRARAPLPRQRFDEKPFWLTAPVDEPAAEDVFAKLFHETFTQAPADGWESLVA